MKNTYFRWAMAALLAASVFSYTYLQYQSYRLQQEQEMTREYQQQTEPGGDIALPDVKLIKQILLIGTRLMSVN